MKLNSLLSTLFVCLFFTASFAQKVDLDPWKFKVSHRNLPFAPLDKSYCTYNVVVTSSSSVNGFFTMPQLESMVSIGGWRKVLEQGHVTLYLSFGDFQITSQNITSRTEDIKDKDQKVIGKKTLYKGTIGYAFQATETTRDYKGKIVYNVTSPLPGSYTWSTSESAVYKDVENALNAGRQNLLKSAVPSLVKQACDIITHYHSYNFGWDVNSLSDWIYLLDSKKHPEYEGHQKVVNFAKDVLGNMTPNESLDSIKIAFEPLKDYLLSTVKTYDKDEKSHKKMRYAAYYALSNIYYWLDDPDNCIKYAEALIANEYDEKDGKKLIEKAKDLKELFKKNNTNTRHFKVDTASFEPPK